MAGARYIMTEADFQALEKRYDRILPSVGEFVNSERQFASRCMRPPRPAVGSYQRGVERGLRTKKEGHCRSYKDPFR